MLAGEYSGIYRGGNLGGDSTKGRLRVLIKSGNDVVVLLDSDKESGCSLDFVYETARGEATPQVWMRHNGISEAEFYLHRADHQGVDGLVFDKDVLRRCALEKNATDCERGNVALLAGKLSLDGKNIELEVSTGLKRDRKEELFTTDKERVRQYRELGTLRFVGTKQEPSAGTQGSK